MNINIKPDDFRPVNCKCGSDLYLPAFKFKKVSKLLTGAPQDQIIPLEVFVCSSCGQILQELLPKEFRDAKEEIKL